MRLYHQVIAGLFASVTTDAWAVDGVGLGEMFPGLAFIFWALLVLGAVFFIYLVFRSDDEHSRQRQLKHLLMTAGVVIAAPYVYEAAGRLHASSLCSTEARTTVLIPPEKWALTHDSSLQEAARRTLFESRTVEPNFGWGVWKQTYYLTDPTAGADLMVSSSFFASKIGRPYGCGGNDIYWKTREEFAKLAQIKYRERDFKGIDDTPVELPRITPLETAEISHITANIVSIKDYADRPIPTGRGGWNDPRPAGSLGWQGNRNCPKNVGWGGASVKQTVLKNNVGWPFVIGEKMFFRGNRDEYNALCQDEFVYLSTTSAQDGKNFINVEKRSLVDFQSVWSAIVVIEKQITPHPQNNLKLSHVSETDAGITWAVINEHDWTELEMTTPVVTAMRPRRPAAADFNVSARPLRLPPPI